MASNYYQIMGLPPMATTSEIKARYKELAKLHHPDVNGDTKTMSLINKAYGVLSDPKSRFEYNKTLIRTKNNLTYTKTSGIKQAAYNPGFTAPYVNNNHAKSKYRFWLSPVSAVLMFLGVFSLIILLNSFAPAQDSAETSNNPPAPAFSSSSNRVPIINITPKTSPAAAPPTVAAIATITPASSKAPSGAVVEQTAAQSQSYQTCSSTISAEAPKAQQLEETIKSEQQQLKDLSHDKGRTFWFHKSPSRHSEEANKLKQKIEDNESQLASYSSSSGSC